jgi:predicted phosphodiesterase
MQRIVSTIPRDCEIIALGDTHRGTVFHHVKGLTKVVEYIGADPLRRWIHMGDWIEAIPSDDRRYDAEIVVDHTPADQAKAIAKSFKPIAPQGLGGLHGNHCMTLRRVANFAKEICEEQLGIPYGTGMCRFILKDAEGRSLFNIFACHGYWLFNSVAKDPEQELANQKAMMKMKMKKLMGDAVIMLCGHAHKLLIAEPINQLYMTDGVGGVKQHYLTTPQNLLGYIPPDQRWYGCTASFRKNQIDGFTDYAEGFPPTELGCLSIMIRDGRPISITPIKV